MQVSKIVLIKVWVVSLVLVFGNISFFSCQTDFSYSDIATHSRGTHFSESDTASGLHWLDRAQSFQDSAQYDTSLILLRLAERRFRNAQDSLGLVSVKNKRVFALWKLGEYSLGLEASDSALQLTDEITELPARILAVTYKNRGLLHSALNQYDEALGFQEEALRQARKSDSSAPQLEATIVTNIASIHFIRGRHDASLKLYNECLILQRTSLPPEHIDIGRTLSNIGLVYMLKGNYPVARQYYSMSDSILVKRRPASITMLGQSLFFQGYIWQSQGDYTKAISYYEQSLETLLEIYDEEHRILGRAYNALGLAYKDLGELNTARRYIRKYFDLSFNGSKSKTRPYAYAKANLGQIEFLSLNYRLSLEHYYEALPVLVELFGDSHLEVGKIYYEIADVYMGLGMPSEALEHYNRSCDILLASENIPEVTEVYQKLASFHAQQTNYSLADEYLSKGLSRLSDGNLDAYIHSVSERPFAPNDLKIAELLFHRGNILYKFHKKLRSPDRQTSDLEILRRSVRSFQAAFDLFDKIRASYISEESKLKLGEKAHELGQQAIFAAVDLSESSGDYSAALQALNFSERSRAMTLIRKLVSRNASQTAGVPDSIQNIEHELVSQVEYYRAQLAEKEKEGGGSPGELAVDRENLFRATQACDEFQSQIRARFPLYHQLTYGFQVPTIDRLQEVLAQTKRALVEYYIGEDSLVIFIVLPDTVILRQKSAVGVRANIKKVRNAINLRKFNQLDDEARELSCAIFGEVLNTTGDRDLYIVTHLELGLTPLELILQSTNDNIDNSDNGLKEFYPNLIFLPSYTWLVLNSDTASDTESDSFLGVAPVQF